MSEDYETPSPDGTQFPDGLRVLAVDDNVVCLKILVTLLEQCRYKVTATTKACEALGMLRENRENFDIVVTDVKMPDMDGFKLLEIIGLEMDIPVIMTSVDDDRSTVLKGVRHGARDYLLKPVRVLEIKNIWQHVVRKNLFDSGKPGIKMEIKAMEMEKSKEQGEGEGGGGGGGGEEEEDHPKEHSFEDGSARKKQRLNWTSELHIKFLNAIHHLGTAERAVPKKILEIMNEPGLSRENVASHLQKYRKMLKKNGTKVSQQTDNSNLDPCRRGRRPSNAAIFSESQSYNSRNPDSRLGVNVDTKAEKPDTPSSSLMYAKPLLQPVENKDMLFQQYLQSPQLAVSSRMHLPGFGGLPSAPLWPGIHPCPLPDFSELNFQTFSPGQQLPRDFMDVSSQFPSYSTSSEPCPLRFPDPSSAFADFSPSSYQTLPDASTGTGTVNPNFFLVQHEGGLVNFNGGQTTVGCPLNIQGPNTESFKENRQIFMQHCQENFDIESSIHLNSCSSTEDDLSAMVKQFNNNGPPNL